MNVLLQTYKTGELSLPDVPIPDRRPGAIRVRVLRSVISVGTEKTKIDTARKSLLDKARARPDLVKQVIAKAKSDGLLRTWETVSARLDTPITLGYSLSGEVLDVGAGVDGIRAGDLVACGGDAAGHAEIAVVPKNLVVNVPEGVDADSGAFATIGAIAMQGVRQAEARVGENVAVIGLGLVGLLTVQILKAAGCRVFGIDIDPKKIAVAKSLGVSDAALADDGDLMEKILVFSDGYGVDSTLVTAGSASSNRPIVQSAEITREKGVVVVVGLTRMDIPREPFYLKELDLRLSRSYGPGRYDPSYEHHGVDYPYAYVRFTEQRNMLSFLQLIQSGAVNLDPIITHRFPFQEAPKAYELIAGDNRPFALGILLEYNRSLNEIPRRIVLHPEAVHGDKISIGVIGAGKYATVNLLPWIEKHSGLGFDGVCTSSGVTAAHVAEKFGFRAAESGADAVINSAGAVIVATRHNDHADLAIRAIKSGKPVFVEKPLVISSEQLDQVREALSESPTASVTVGFNRRFAPATRLALQHCPTGNAIPRQVLIRVNAGPIPADHWVHDPKIGGGRLIGEGCHFVDLAVALTNSEITGISASAVPRPQTSAALLDNFVINLSHADGSVTAVAYNSVGDPRLAKEYIEVHTGGKSAIINDFKSVDLWEKGRCKKERWSNQDKGQKNQIDAWATALRSGTSSIPIKHILNVHEACLAAIRSIENFQMIRIASGLF